MESSLFAGLREAEKQLFLEVFQEKKIPKDQLVKQEGERMQKAFFLREGELLVQKQTSDENMEIGRIGSDEDIFFSVDCLLYEGNSLTTVKATQESIILEILQKDFFDFCQNNEAVGVKILANLTQLLIQFLRKNDSKIAEMYKTLEEVL